MKNKIRNFIPYLAFLLLLLSLIPLVWLGRYDYPTGDDYYYGAEAHLVWQQTKSIPQAISAACTGVATSYRIWQGTYSALFLMYLAPNAFSMTAYHLVPFAILLLLCGGIFYLLRPLVCRFLTGTTGEWITISSVLSFLCVQTVVFQSDSFYWYNGSMYYTGFYAVTLFFLGTLLRYLYSGRMLLLLPLLLFAIFLGGGNYVSLLPCMLLLATVTLLLLLQKNKKSLICGITTIVLLSAFAVSAMAPGNHVRQDGMWKLPHGKPLRNRCYRVSAILLPGPGCGGFWLPYYCCLFFCIFCAEKKTAFPSIFPTLFCLPDIFTDCSALCPVRCSIP